MKSSTQKIILERFNEYLNENFSNLTEHQRHKIATDLGEISKDIVLESNKGLSDLYQSASLELEQHKKKFLDHIEHIDKGGRAMIENFKRKSFVQVQRDKKTGKQILVGRTTMVDEMVEFLNVLNDAVLDFYQNVYQINHPESPKSVQNTSLFS